MEVTFEDNARRYGALEGEATTVKGTSHPRASILLVDDDVELGELMQEFFDRHGLQFETIHDSRRGLARALNGDHDLILLDVMMPGINGFELLRQVRRR
ncbi:response regulator, partial [Singulisphaera rosea]